MDSEALQDSVFLMFENRSNNCWMNSPLILIAHNKVIKKIAENNGSSKINEIISTYDEAIHTINDKSVDITCRKLSIKEKLFNLQTNIHQFLQPLLKYETGKPDSAFNALLALINDNKAVKNQLSISWLWKNKCTSCGRRLNSETINERPIITLPQVNNFDPSLPILVYRCPCDTEQEMRLIYKQLPPCIFFHFENGAGNGNEPPLLFVAKDRKYHLTGIIMLEKGTLNHFVTWIRDPFTNKWMECNDLGEIVVSFSSKKLQFNLKDVYMYIFETFDNFGKVTIEISAENCQTDDFKNDIEVIDITNDLDVNTDTTGSFVSASEDGVKNVEKSVANLILHDSPVHSAQAAVKKGKEYISSGKSIFKNAPVRNFRIEKYIPPKPEKQSTINFNEQELQSRMQQTLLKRDPHLNTSEDATVSKVDMEQSKSKEKSVTEVSTFMNNLDASDKRKYSDASIIKKNIGSGKPVFKNTLVENFRIFAADKQQVDSETMYKLNNVPENIKKAVSLFGKNDEGKLLVNSIEEDLNGCKNAILSTNSKKHYVKKSINNIKDNQQQFKQPVIENSLVQPTSDIENAQSVIQPCIINTNFKQNYDESSMIHPKQSTSDDKQKLQLKMQETLKRDPHLNTIEERYKVAIVSTSDVRKLEFDNLKDISVQAKPVLKKQDVPDQYVMDVDSEFCSVSIMNKSIEENQNLFNPHKEVDSQSCNESIANENLIPSAIIETLDRADLSREVDTQGCSVSSMGENAAENKDSTQHNNVEKVDYMAEIGKLINRNFEFSLTAFLKDIGIMQNFTKASESENSKRISVQAKPVLKKQDVPDQFAMEVDSESCSTSVINKSVDRNQNLLDPNKEVQSCSKSTTNENLIRCAIIETPDHSDLNSGVDSQGYSVRICENAAGNKDSSQHNVEKVDYRSEIEELIDRNVESSLIALLEDIGITQNFMF